MVKLKVMNQVIFSVIVTAYNQPQEIKRAVESVLNQTVKCFELIVVDDCSTDETPKVLADFAAKNPCMKVFRHEKNGGSHAARCTGVAQAGGEYVLFLDGDDYLCADALERLLKDVVNAGEASTVDADFDVCEFSYICQPGGEVIKPVPREMATPRIDYFLNKDSKVTVWNKLYRADLVKKAFSSMQKEYIRCGDDTYESICLAYFTKKFIQKDVLVTNYVTEGGVSLRKNNFESNLRHCQSLGTSLECLREFFADNKYEKSGELLQIVEKKYFDWILSVMKNNTELDDITRSLIQLPKYFSCELIEPYFNKLYSRELKKKRVKHFIKKIIK